MLRVADSLSRAHNYYADAGDVERTVEVAVCQYTAFSGRSLGVAQLIVFKIPAGKSGRTPAGQGGGKWINSPLLTQ